MQAYKLLIILGLVISTSYCEEISVSIPAKYVVKTEKGDGIALAGQVVNIELPKPLEEGTVSVWVKSSKETTPENTTNILALVGDGGYFEFLYHAGKIPMVYGFFKEKDSLSNGQQVSPAQSYNWIFCWKTDTNKNVIGSFYFNGKKIGEKKLKMPKINPIAKIRLGSKNFTGELSGLKIFDSAIDIPKFIGSETGTAYENNLISNGGFEAINSNGVPYGWLHDIWNMPADKSREEIAIFKINNETPKSGNYCQQISTIFSGGRQAWPVIFTYVPLKKGQKYQLSFSSRQTGMADGPTLLFRCNQKGTVPYIHTKLSIADKWTSNSYEFTSPRDDEKAQLIFLNHGNSGNWWIDDVVLKEINN